MLILYLGVQKTLNCFGNNDRLHENMVWLTMWCHIVDHYIQYKQPYLQQSQQPWESVWGGGGVGDNITVDEVIEQF